MKPTLSHVVSAVVVGFLVILTGAARRGVPTVDRATGLLLFRHHLVLRAFALVAAFGIPIALTALVISNPPKNQNDYVAITCLYLLFAGLSAPLLWETTRYALLVGPEGLDCRSPWRGRQFFRWDEVEKVSFSTVASWFVLHATGGRKFRVPMYISGVRAFLEQCEQRLSPSQLAEAEPGYRVVNRPFPR
jgi:hypothetical protein